VLVVLGGTPGVHHGEGGEELSLKEHCGWLRSTARSDDLQ
jgi:hypothetical protein